MNNQHRTLLVLGGVALIMTIGIVFVALDQKPAAQYAKEFMAKCAGVDATTTSCLVSMVGNLAIEKGTGTAFRVVRELYPDFPQKNESCFDFANLVGEYVADTQPNYRSIKLEPESVFCNYGFYQSYARKFLLNSRDTKKAQDLCAYVLQSLGSVSSGVAEECYRGVGNALPFIQPDIQGDPVAISKYAIRMCEALAPEGEQRGACLSGLFSRIGLSEQKGLYGLSVDANDPLSLCHQQPQEYFFRCEGNYKRSIVGSRVPHDLTKALDELEAKYPDLDPDDINAIAYTVGYDSVAASVPRPNFETLAHSCLSQAEPIQGQCISGTAVGLAKNGIPGQQDTQVLQFCNVVAQEKGEQSPLCPSDVALLYMRGFFTSEKFSSICKEFGLSTGLCAK